MVYARIKISMGTGFKLQEHVITKVVLLTGLSKADVYWWGERVAELQQYQAWMPPKFTHQQDTMRRFGEISARMLEAIQ